MMLFSLGSYRVDSHGCVRLLLSFRRNITANSGAGRYQYMYTVADQLIGKEPFGKKILNKNLSYIKQ